MTDNTIIKIKTTDEFIVPNLPNFIKRPDGSQIAVKQLSDKALSSIGKAWTAELIKKASPSTPDDEIGPGPTVNQDPTTESNFFKRDGN